MKHFKTKLILPILPILIFSHPAVANICEIDRGTLEENLNKIDMTIDSIVETDLPSNTKISLLSELAPKFAAFVDVAGKIGTVAGLSIGAYEILDGVKTHNEGEIIDGSLNIASIVAPEVVSTVVGELFGEAVGGIAGGAVAFLAIEGLNIYNGVKIDRVISDLKGQNANLGKIYGDYVWRLENGLKETKRVIAGDANEFYHVSTENFGKVALALTKRSVDSIANHVYLREIKAESARVSQANHSKNVLSYFEQAPATNKSQLIADLRTINSELDSWYTIDEPYAKHRWVPDIGYYSISQEYFFTIGQAAGLPEEETLRNIRDPLVWSKGFVEHYRPMAEWSAHNLNGVVSQVVDQTFDDKDKLANDYHAVVKEMLTEYPKIQATMLEDYNNVIAKRYSWLKFGQELMNHLDYSDEEVRNGFAWTFRIINPILESFLESKIDKKLVEDTQVAPMTSSIVTHIINAGLDINNPDAYHNVKALFTHEKAPSALTNAFENAFTAAKSAANSRLLAQSDLKPVVLGDQVIADHLAQTQIMIDNGTLKGMLDGAINSHLTEEVYMTFHQYEKLAEYAEAASKVHWAYNKTVIEIIAGRIDQLSNLQNDDQIANILTGLETELVANYSSFKQKDLSLDPKYKWVSFNTLPQTQSELKSLRTFIKNNRNAASANNTSNNSNF